MGCVEASSDAMAGLVADLSDFLTAQSDLSPDLLEHEHSPDLSKAGAVPATSLKSLLLHKSLPCKFSRAVNTGCGGG